MPGLAAAAEHVEAAATISPAAAMRADFSL